MLIMYIDAAKNLSVQVHPNDEYAQKYEHDNGKTEMWYIVSADDGAGIYCGFKRDTDKEEFLAKVKDGTVEELLNFIPVKAGDCYLIKAGTVHAIASVFKEIGWAEELGSGVRNIVKYSKVYSGTTPEFIDGDVFKTKISLNEINRSDVGVNVGVKLSEINLKF